VLIVDLPKTGITTVYGCLGDWFPLVCLLTVLVAAAAARKRRATVAKGVVGSSREFDGPVRGVSSGA
jgi:hypothetical protein